MRFSDKGDSNALQPKVVRKWTSHSKFTKERHLKEKERAINQKSKMLRDYAKLCKKEGIESSRVNIGGVKRNVESTSFTSSRIQKKEHNKPKSSLIRAYEKAVDSKKVEVETRNEAEIRKAEDLEKATNQRKAKNKLRMQKTKKGQPIMGNQIKAILSKLTVEK